MYIQTYINSPKFLFYNHNLLFDKNNMFFHTQKELHNQNDQKFVVDKCLLSYYCLILL